MNVGPLWLVLILSIAILAILASRAIVRTRHTDSNLPYSKRQYLFSKAERSFFEVLHRVASPRFHVFAKVRVVDLLMVKGSPPSATGSHRNRILSKHVDFVLCDRELVSPKIAIELDDASHNRPDRQVRDAFLARAFRAAGLPLLRVSAAKSYDTRVLQRLLDEVLQGAGSPANAETPESGSRPDAR